MPQSLIDVEAFKTVLGVGDLYPDADLEQVCQAATNILLAYLTMYSSHADLVWDATENTVTIRTTRPHGFTVGLSVVLRGFGLEGWDRTVTVTEIPALDRLVVTSAVPWEDAPVDPAPIIPTGTIYAEYQINFYTTVPEVVEAATAIAVDMWQSRLAPGGQINAVDFTPGPYRMGRSLITRISGLIGQHINTGGLVG